MDVQLTRAGICEIARCNQEQKQSNAEQDGGMTHGRQNNENSTVITLRCTRSEIHKRGYKPADKNETFSLIQDLNFIYVEPFLHILECWVMNKKQFDLVILTFQSASTYSLSPSRPVL